MSKTATILQRITIAGEATEQSVSLTGATLTDVDQSIAATGIPVTVPDFNIDQSAMQLLYVLSDQDLTLSFATNNSPIEITLVANVPLVWFDGCGLTNPITEDVVGLTADNNGDTAAALKIKCLTAAS